MVKPIYDDRPAGQPGRDRSDLSLPDYKIDIYSDLELATRSEGCRVTLVGGKSHVGRLVYSRDTQSCLIYSGDRSIRLRLDQILTITDFEGIHPRETIERVPGLQRPLHLLAHLRELTSGHQ